MKKYIETKNCLQLDHSFIPKDLSNFDYKQALKEIESGQAELISFDIESANWEQIRSQRSILLKSCDWVAFPDVTHPKKQAWLDYRQALRDLPQNFTNSKDVVWPQEP